MSITLLGVMGGSRGGAQMAGVNLAIQDINARAVGLLPNLDAQNPISAVKDLDAKMASTSKQNALAGRITACGGHFTSISLPF